MSSHQIKKLIVYYTHEGVTKTRTVTNQKEIQTLLQLKHKINPKELRFKAVHH